MDLLNEEASDRVPQHKDNVYGQTVVQDDACAIQGNVNISRDVHIHLHSQLDTLAGADAVVGLLHIANTFLNLKESIQHEPPEQWSKDLAKAISRLEQVESELRVQEGRVRARASYSYPETNVSYIHCISM